MKLGSRSAKREAVVRSFLLLSDRGSSPTGLRSVTQMAYVGRVSQVRAVTHAARFMPENGRVGTCPQ
jgi:hypothetical protein